MNKKQFIILCLGLLSQAIVLYCNQIEYITVFLWGETLVCIAIYDCLTKTKGE